MNHRSKQAATNNLVTQGRKYRGLDGQHPKFAVPQKKENARRNSSGVFFLASTSLGVTTSPFLAKLVDFGTGPDQSAFARWPHRLSEWSGTTHKLPPSPFPSGGPTKSDGTPVRSKVIVMSDSVSNIVPGSEPVSYSPVTKLNNLAVTIRLAFADSFLASMQI